MSCCCCCDSLPQAQLPALTQELTREEVNAMNDADRVNYCYQLSMKKIKEHHGHDHEKLNCYELLVEVMDFVSSVSRFGSASYLWERYDDADVHLNKVISGLETLLSEEEWNKNDADKVIESAKDWHFSSLSPSVSSRLYSGDVSVLDEVKSLSQQYHPDLLEEAVTAATNAPNGGENELFNDERFKRAFKSYKMNPEVKPILSKCDAVFRVAHEPISDRLISYTKKHLDEFVNE